MVERTHAHGENAIVIEQWPSQQGVDIREVGSDVAKGEIVLQQGARIGAAEIGLLAQTGVSEVDVVRRPKIGVLSTGDELVNVGAAVGDGKIVDSNRPMLLAAVSEYFPFCEAIDLGCVPDTHESVSHAVQTDVKNVDILVTSGGVSMGDRDVVQQVLGEVGEVLFGRVLMKPGKPLTYAVVGQDARACCVGLPGNPVSAFVCFQLAVGVAARRLAGWDVAEARGVMVEVVLGDEVRLDRSRPEFHRARLEVGCG